MHLTSHYNSVRR